MTGQQVNVPSSNAEAVPSLFRQTLINDRQTTRTDEQRSNRISRD